MDLIDRAVAVLKPNEPYLEWALGLPDAPADLTLQELRSDCTAFLIPEFDLDQEVEDLLREIYPALFELELEGWYRDERFWPQPRDYETFRAWFDVEISSTVIDLVEDEIAKEEY